MHRRAIRTVRGRKVATLLAICGGVFSALATLTPAAHAQVGTVFTYQGQLTNAGQPATGAHDLRFRLFDSASGTTQIGPTLCSDNVALLADGRFAVELDFGSVYSGQSRFLEIEVRPDTGVSCASAAGFLVLGPRQSLTAAPYAVRAASAGSATTADSASTALALNGQPASFYQNAANLTSGSLPGARLAGTYPGTISFTGPITLSNPTNTIAGSGAGLINLNADNIASGVLTPTNGGTGSDTSGATDGEVLKFFSGRWVGAADNDTTYTAGAGLQLIGTTFSVAGGSVSNQMLADNSVDTFKIAPSAVTSSDISDNSISTTKIVNGAITSLKLGAGSVAGGVGGTITDGSIGPTDLAGNAVNSGNTADNTIASIDILDATIGAADMGAGSVSGGTLGTILDSSITSADIAPDSIIATDIAAGGVGSSEILSNSVNNTDLATDAASLEKVSGGLIQTNGSQIGIGGPPNPNRTLSIQGNAEFQLGLNTPGSITAAEFTLLNPLQRVYSIGPHDFAVRENSLANGNSASDLSGEPFLFNSVELASAEGTAPVHLPDGAEIVSLEILVQDEATFEDATALLLRRSLRGSAGGTIASISSSGQVPGTFRSFTDTTISGGVIDNANNMYFVHLSIDGAISAINFKGAVIRYRITRPLP